MNSVSADEGVVFHRSQANSDTAIVSFSSRAAVDGKFSFFTLSEQLPEFSALLVRDPSRNWYNAGLPGVGETIEEIALAIQAEVRALGATRTITIGSSMGGYAAILFGCLIGSERAVAISAQTLLDPILRLSPSADVPLQAPDLRAVMAKAPRTAVSIVAGWDDIVDVFHAQRIADLPSVRVLAMPGGRHAFIRQLNERGEFWPFLAELIDGAAPAACQVDPACEPADRERISTAVFALARREWDLGIAALTPLVRSSPDWAGPNLMLGLALSQIGDWGAAETAFDAALRSNTDWMLPRRLLAKALLEQSRHAEAEVEIKRCLEQNPDWAEGRRLLARCVRT